MKFLLILMTLTAKACLGANFCGDPQTIEFFPLSGTITVGTCSPGTFDLIPNGTINYGQCSYCGNAAAMVEVNDQNGENENYLSSPSISTEVFSRANFVN